MGIQFVSAGAFEAILGSHIEPWTNAHGPLPIYAFGMVGSRNGWREMPYIDCPARPRDVIAAMLRLTTGMGQSVILAPGITDSARTAAPDVMRGEEVLLFALPQSGTHTAILPGTHSKWATVKDGRLLVSKPSSPENSIHF